MRRSSWSLLLSVCVAIWAVPVLADDDENNDDRPGRGGFGQGQGGFGQGRGQGGFGGFGGGRGFGRFDMTFPLLGNEKVQTELNISEEQQEQITALQEDSMANMPDFRDQFETLGEDATEEERQAVWSEWQDAMQAQQAETRAKLADILAADQLDRLRQIRWQVGGIRSLQDEEVEEALGISEEQQTEIDELMEERDDTRPGRDASDEERTAHTEEWDGKIKGVLTEDQQETWTVLLGDTFEIDRGELFGGFGGGRGGFGGPGGGGGFGGGRPGGGGGRPEADRPDAEDDDEGDDESEDDDEV